MKTTKTIRYTLAKLDRTNQPKPTFESTTKIVFKRINKYLFSKLYSGILFINKVNDKMQGYGRNGYRENKAVDFHANLAKANHQRKLKQIYNIFGLPQSTEKTTQEIINDLRFGKL